MLLVDTPFATNLFRTNGPAFDQVDRLFHGRAQVRREIRDGEDIYVADSRLRTHNGRLWTIGRKVAVREVTEGDRKAERASVVQVDAVIRIRLHRRCANRRPHVHDKVDESVAVDVDELAAHLASTNLISDWLTLSVCREILKEERWKRLRVFQGVVGLPTCGGTQEELDVRCEMNMRYFVRV